MSRYSEVGVIVIHELI